MAARYATGCVIPGCTRPFKARGYCGAHYARLLAHGDPLIVKSRGDASRLPHFSGAESPRWQGNDIGYGAVHQRLYVARGKASAQPCAHCLRPARQWAYDYTDPEPLVDSRGCPYSPDIARYVPLCSSCHKLYDLAQVGA